MCGIAGVLSKRPQDMRALFLMTEVQAHRGPDSVGHVFCADGRMSAIVDHPEQLQAEPFAELALGHRRLAIVDCSMDGRQPMSDPSGRYWITYNGEVYNYLELRAELRASGYGFSTASDTEVILRAYEAWGTGCFARFNGMWGMAIWDARERVLVLARDRMGVKPLYLNRSDGVLTFASEIKGVLASGRISARCQTDQAMAYLTDALVNHTNASFFEGIESFPPASFAVVAANEPMVVRPQTYWELPQQTSQTSYLQAQEQFRVLFESAVKLRMRSDVPVGSCLSGGLDSSAIVCQMSRLQTGQGLHTFTSAFEDPRFDESRWARMVAESITAQAHWTTPSQEGLINELDALIWHQEEPFYSSSVYAQWCVMRRAREAGIPVLLDGQGADETLLGYRKFYLFYLRQLAAAGRWIEAGQQAVALLRFGDRGTFKPIEALRYMPARLLPAGVAIKDYANPAMQTPSGTDTAEFRRGSSIQTHQLNDLSRFSLPALLRYEDRNSMAWSIESRVPFLDYRLVESLVALPVSHKLAGGRTKRVLRDALSGLVPPAILARRDKMGFVTPQSVWMDDRLGQVLADEIRNSPLLARLLDSRRLHAAWTAASGRRRLTMQAGVFRAGLLAVWARRFGLS